MLETGLHQGAGLQGLASHTAPRLVVMASHGDRASELPLLWDLCAAWTELGYPVVVLDATHSETPQQPGLQQLLDPGAAEAGATDPPVAQDSPGLLAYLDALAERTVRFFMREG